MQPERDGRGSDGELVVRSSRWWREDATRGRRGWRRPAGDAQGREGFGGGSEEGEEEAEGGRWALDQEEERCEVKGEGSRCVDRVGEHARAREFEASEPWRRGVVSSQLRKGILGE